MLHFSPLKASALFCALLIASVSNAQGDRFYPDIEGKQLSTVETLLSDLGVKLTIKKVDSPIRKGQVIKQIPPAKTPLGQAAEMYLVVANGLVVPKVNSKNVNMVKAELEKIGLSVEISRRPIQGVANGIVDFITPEPGTRIDPENEAVFLVVSNTEMVKVPDNLIGIDIRDVMKNNKIKFVPTPQIDKGPHFRCYEPAVYRYIVTSSSVAPGKLVTVGSQVKLQYRRETVIESRRICNEEGVIY